MQLAFTNLRVLEKPHCCGLSADCIWFSFLLLYFIILNLFLYYTELISVLQGRFPNAFLSVLSLK